MKKVLFILLFTAGGFLSSFAQEITRQDIIQISGYAYANDSSLAKLPYVKVLIKGTGRGTFTDESGFFSIAILKSDTLSFSTLGYAPRTYYLKKDDWNKGELTTAILMDPISYELDAVTVRGLTVEAFRREFLALQLPDDAYSPNALIDVNELGMPAPDLSPGFSPGISLSPTELLQRVPFIQKALRRKRARDISEDPDVSIPEMK
ncbi:carboxypeptidase-like regulatory domain-containing protein [Anseongella ginsenosidimutans]|uniref:carboxypeptidase-like regulatory domain-containing protein n=1 Tax=Anseongella ginsenosidimutans TaxID=496056 RepID=UPI0013157C35|nr:carboxypeptidase-like regulatory domain-containing protein [Anseongella ginsenosidimutans]